MGLTARFMVAAMLFQQQQQHHHHQAWALSGLEGPHPHRDLGGSFSSRSRSHRRRHLVSGSSAPTVDTARLAELERLLPAGTNASLLVEMAPRLLEAPAAEAAAKLEAHTRSGATERGRHDVLCRLTRALLEGQGAETVHDVPLALLPMAAPSALGDGATALKRSRRVDIVAMHLERRRVWLVEVTVVRDGTLGVREAEKAAKYADLPALLESSSWVQERGLAVSEPVVLAVGVYGTVSDSTAAALGRVAVELSLPASDVDLFLDEARQTVLRWNLAPFLPREEQPWLGGRRRASARGRGRAPRGGGSPKKKRKPNNKR